MTWTPANHTTICSEYPTMVTCQPDILTYLALLVQLLGHSMDENFSDIRKVGHKAEETSNNDPMEYFDFIIVGGGAAGSVLAHRLSEISHWKILLMEAGEEEPVIANIPGMCRLLKYSSIDYAYQTQPEPIADTMEDRTDYWPRGKVMGGSSTINTMWYVRGNRLDYDEWARQGNPGWGWDDVLHYFKKGEDCRVEQILEKNPDTHGVGGPMTVERFPHFDENARTIFNAWKELGFKEIDYNAGKRQIGTSKLQFNTIHGAHQSANGAYVRPIRGKRQNLTIMTKAQVTRILIDQMTKQAHGVEFINYKTKSLQRAFAIKEVIVAGGAIESPKLLMLSGIGPAHHLHEADIPVVMNLAVGDNLQDHPMVYPIRFLMHDNVSTFGTVEDMQNDLMYWLSSHEGPLSALGLMDTVTYFQTSNEKNPDVPDIHFGFTGFIAENPDKWKFHYVPMSYYNEVRLSTTLLNPKSRGVIKLDLLNPLGDPLIYPNYLQHPHDVNVLVEGVHMARKIVDTNEFRKSGFIHLKEPAEGCEHLPFESTAYFTCLANRHVTTAFHPSGTCKMGPKTDRGAVVDPRLRVHGMSRLRVIDASIMPTLIRGNTYAPALMIAEKGSDMIKEDWLGVQAVQKPTSNQERGQRPASGSRGGFTGGVQIALKPALGPRGGSSRGSNGAQRTSSGLGGGPNRGNSSGQRTTSGLSVGSNGGSSSGQRTTSGSSVGSNGGSSSGQRTTSGLSVGSNGGSSSGQRTASGLGGGSNRGSDSGRRSMSGSRGMTYSFQHLLRSMANRGFSTRTQ